MRISILLLVLLVASSFGDSWYGTIITSGRCDRSLADGDGRCFSYESRFRFYRDSTGTPAYFLQEVDAESSRFTITSWSVGRAVFTAIAQTSKGVEFTLTADTTTGAVLLSGPLYEGRYMVLDAEFQGFSDTIGTEIEPIIVIPPGSL